MKSLKRISVKVSSCLSLFLALGSSLSAYEVTHTVKKLDSHAQEITLTFSLQPEEYLYKDSMPTSVNSPFITLSPLQPSTPALTLFDKALKTEKEVYTGPITFTITANLDKSAEASQALLFVPFMINTLKDPQQISIPLDFTQTEPPTARVLEEAPTSDQQKSSSTLPLTPVSQSPQRDQPATSLPVPFEQPSYIYTLFSGVHSVGMSIKNFLSSLFSSTGSPFVRAGATFLLGLLLSLTPCIYPMIPITVGILQASGSTSTFKNFLLALSYTLGISTIFALFGFLAAMGGPAFGELQGNPWFILPVSALFFYFGLSMFDFVQIPIPKFLQPKTSKVQGGSLLSAYLFGAASGTIASPCLSPGLILILHYVASVASGAFMGYVEGFILLFLFGIGSSIPLLLIGTFSGSLKKLPRSGVWMVEIKKLIGIMLISMALYHLSHLERIFPWHIMVWIVVITYVCLSIFYFSKSSSNDSTKMNIYRMGVGALLFVSAVLIAVQGHKALYDHWHPIIKDNRLNDYIQAVAKAKQEGKLLFADIGASYCSACKALHTSIFVKPPIVEALQQFVVLALESDIHVDSYKMLRAAYTPYIEGFPTYLVINPNTGKVIQKWSVEIDQKGIPAFKAELDALAHAHSSSRLEKSGE